MKVISLFAWLLVLALSDTNVMAKKKHKKSKKHKNAAQSKKHSIKDSSEHVSFDDPSKSFVCNEPFFIPAEFIDPRGNHFAMCLSDPRFQRQRLIWYIQDLNGSYKAVGMAGRRDGSRGWAGMIIPIEEPETGKGLIGEPVKMHVNIDLSAGSISMTPDSGSKASHVDWTIRPHGFPRGSLQVPHSCGPFLQKVTHPDLLAPLTGAGKSASVCIIPTPLSDGYEAFISWGSAHPHSTAVDSSVDAASAFDDQLFLDQQRFFSLGFVGNDRGVSIDICDPWSDATRCEMSRLVDHVRKTYVVGSEETMQLMKQNHDLRKKKQSCPKHSHGVAKKAGRSDELKSKLKRIEHDLEEILKRSSVHKEHKALTTSDDDSDQDEKHLFKKHGVKCHVHKHKEHPKEKKVKKHKKAKKARKHKKAKTDEHQSDDSSCDIHPLLHPHRHRVLKDDDGNLQAKMNFLNNRMMRLEAEIAQAEVFINDRMQRFWKWMKGRRASLERMARSFKKRIAYLNDNTVVPSKPSNFLQKIGKEIQKDADFATASSASTASMNDDSPASYDLDNRDEDQKIKQLAREEAEIRRELAQLEVRHYYDTDLGTTAGPTRETKRRRRSRTDGDDSVGTLDTLSPDPLGSAPPTYDSGQVNPLGPVGPVMPPPARANYPSRSTSTPNQPAAGSNYYDDPTWVAAADYLN